LGLNDRDELLSPGANYHFLEMAITRIENECFSNLQIQPKNKHHIYNSNLAVLAKLKGLTLTGG
jgi:hypothetical protein